MTPKEILKRLFQYARPYAGYLIGGLLCAVASIALTLLGPVLIGKAIDQIVGPGQVNFPETLKYLILLGITVALAAVFQWLMTLCTNKVTYYTVNDLRQEAFGKLHQVPLKYIDGNPHGDIINRLINDIDFISDGLLQGLTQLFTGVVTIVGTLCFMLGINPLIALVVVLVTPLSLFVAVFVAKSSNKMFKEQTKTQGELGGCVEEMLGSQKVVKAFSYEERAEEKFQEINARLYKCGQKAQFFSSLSNPSTRFVNGIVYAAAGVVGAISVINGNLSVGGVSSFLTYANQYTKPFNEVTGVITQLQTAFSSAGRVFALLDQPEEAPDAPDAKTVKSCEGRVRIDHVSFAYRKDQKLIENFNLETKPGQRIAIVGPTGCGNRKEGNFFLPGYDRGLSRSYGNGEYRRGGGGFGDRWTGRDFLDVGGGPVWDDDYFRRECPWLPLPAKKQKRRVGGRPDVLSLERASQPLFGGPVFGCLYFFLFWDGQHDPGQFHCRSHGGWIFGSTLGYGNGAGPVGGSDYPGRPKKDSRVYGKDCALYECILFNWLSGGHRGPRRQTASGV